ncbi:HPP family protein [Caulobacter sp. Root1455]|uniref:HPP family protein n=1 Tax=Caulobacter sp. Root1455 TaxID=1736465 RepID=UPI000AAF109E|nr:HPP family protein [Caulobacter sp. Root1455]
MTAEETLQAGARGARRFLRTPVAGWMAFAGLGAAFCVGALVLASRLTAIPYWQIPFITSIALVMGAPRSEPAKPKALIGGHLTAALAGYLVLLVGGSSPTLAAVAVGLAVIAMLRLKVFHPPAAVDAFLVVNLGLKIGYLFSVILLGAMLLAGFSFVWRKLTDRVVPRPEPEREP